MRKTTYIILSLCFVASVGARNPAYDPTPWNEGSGSFLKSQPEQEDPPQAPMPKESKKQVVDPKPWHVGERHPYLEGDNKGCCVKTDTTCMEEGRQMCLGEDAPAKK